MPRFLLQHRHESADCGAAFAAFKGHASPLRHRPAIASCVSGDHAIWWTVDAESEQSALALLPYFVAQRTVANRITETDIP
jgi:hypothetical protein